jgi:DeoR/GlpR family transcriptional regulator of sugar metabolism
MIEVAESYCTCGFYKMNIRGFGKICNLNKIDVLITDDGIDVETKMRLEIGINVVIAGKCSSISLVQAFSIC